MTTNSQLPTTEPKQKLSKQLEQEQNHRNGDHMGSYQWGGVVERMREKVQGIRSIIGITCLTQGHELSGGNARGRGSW